MRTLKYSILTLIGIVHLIPFYILLGMALKPTEDTSSKWIFPTNMTMDNFVNAWNQAHLSQALINNVIITGSSVVLIVLIGALASYPLSRFQTKWNQFIYLLCISCMIVPALTILVPLYSMIVDMGGINTYWAAILTQVTFQLPLTIFLFTGFISSVPRELDEAGSIDGCNKFMIFFRIILPLLKPITATVIILTGLNVWNDYQFSIFLLQKVSVQTIPVALSQFISQFQNQISWVAAGCVIGMLPVTILYLFLQKYFIRGLADGAVKG
ncbi:carbohydrate ABC transporter permease [Paenibacillus macquariensis]|uniref:Carbohydrate ABC transporter membrane protein 2, CUT1 family n=1 Tax=Paenibacillus macquariensis TaxID=948756 RepID=A0ABY1JR49_9BACL|nr:carbohydrate ABC transporter permease [Paenibacillus macquariensis]MEC0092699.1 carbohydrate ABC transporter permease [Paenibacillus macquariensis]OAB36632.1 maltose ABC transporter permease [Paenibacillus macquariensis subsp. macquariensis]SIQ64154.1 carbohydrate ABC transporter membrane protein 2, CUT1 family [Paenibacillus macquariensis]